MCSPDHVTKALTYPMSLPNITLSLHCREWAPTARKKRGNSGGGGLNLGKEERVIFIQNACMRKNTIVNRILQSESMPIGTLKLRGLGRGLTIPITGIYHTGIMTCLDATVLFRSPIQIALFLPPQNGEKGHFHSRNGHPTERSHFCQTGHYIIQLIKTSAIRPSLKIFIRCRR